MCVGKNSLEDLDWSALRFTFKWILVRTNVQSQTLPEENETFSIPLCGIGGEP